jgi:hypothetical protein
MTKRRKPGKKQVRVGQRGKSRSAKASAAEVNIETGNGKDSKGIPEQSAELGQSQQSYKK